VTIAGIEALHVHVGNDAANMAFQVACVATSSAPTLGNLKKVFADRHGNYLYPLVVRALHGSNATLFGPNPESTVWEISNEQAERVLQDALNQPSGFVAQQKYSQHRKAFMSAANLGVANAGLFANYYLQNAITTRKDWLEHCERGTSLLKHRGKDLVHQLGFTESFASADAILLSGTATGHKRAVAILLNEDEQFEAHSHRFNLTPIAYGLSVAAKNEVPWLMVLRGSEIRLYPAKDGVGVGQRSQAETYFELNLSVIPENQIGLLDLVFSASALEAGGTVEELLNGSARFATDLGSRLRARIYEHVVPELAKGVAQQLPNLGLEVNAANLTLAYRLTLRILFRLLFQAYAEDKGLLPYERNERFTANALKTLVIRDLIPNAEDVFDENSTALWDDLAQVWKVIDGGDSAWNIPAYNGGLFGNDSERQPEGALINRLAIPNHIMGPALKHMLVDTTEEGNLGPVDFGSLSVREFGTIYEGLLESSLSLADSDLTLDKNGAWIPAQTGDKVEAAKGTAYFHNSSGERKATGSYFTPSIIVEHLLDRALEPALENHLAKVKSLVDKGKESDAADLFFDFRVADLAMGSAHFLVAAVDRIETAFRNFMVETPVPKVRAELKRLGDAARLALGTDAEFVGDIDDALLLRRQIARRCIYGIDVNDMAVELARLALWIHTFVPGLPMSSLDHGLVCANSLTGIGTIDEALQALDPKAGQGAFFSDDIFASLDASRKLLIEASAADEATKMEIEAARELSEEAKKQTEPIKYIFDAAVAARLKTLGSGSMLSVEEMVTAGSTDTVQNLVSTLMPAHLPYLFPEVFLRENPGFDVLLGNPPWEELTLEANKFWRRFSLVPVGTDFTPELLDQLRFARPDLAELLDEETNQTSAMRKAVLAGPFPGMGTGDPDLYKGFAWRNMLACREHGRIGLVLPFSAWNAMGSSTWRASLLPRASVQLDLFRNEGGWLFENVNPGYRISTVTCMLDSGAEIEIRGEFRSPGDFVSGKAALAPTLKLELLRDRDPEICIPAVTSPSDLELWAHLVSFGSLGDGRRPVRQDFRCAPATEIHVTNDGGKKGVFTANEDDHPVHNHLNVENLVFNHDAGTFNFANFELELARQQALRAKTFSRADSPFSVRDASWNLDAKSHPIEHPRIVFRDVVHASNKRKAWFALAPSKTLLTNSSPYLVFSDDDVAVQAYVLGILTSPIVDWYAHLRVNLHLNFFILYTLPVPSFTGSHIANRIGQLAAGLATGVDGNYGVWAKFAPPITGIEAQREAIAELAALACLEFHLSEAQIKVVLDDTNSTRPRLADVMKFYDEWKALG
jgi:hypothetical protein